MKTQRFANTVIIEGVLNGNTLHEITMALADTKMDHWSGRDLLKWTEATLEAAVRNKVMEAAVAKPYLDKICHALADIMYC